MGTGTAAAGAVTGGSKWRALALPLLAAIAGLLLAAAPAQASFHLMKIREVFTGGAGGGSYVELQMWTGGQNAVKNHVVTVYNPNGSSAHSFSIPNNVANGQSQATVLIAGPGYGGSPAADATDPGLNLPAAGGAVCFNDAEPPDCVAWGNFTGAPSLPSATGTPVSTGGVTAGKALRRSIAAGCATLLQPSDDTDNSAADFSEQDPNPRSNASAIVEHECNPPVATIKQKPANPTNSTSASFTYESTPPGADFECKLDVGAFLPCEASGIEYPGPLGQGTHTFQVQADDGVETGPAAKYEWKIDTAPPVAEIKTNPPDPGPGKSAAFTYSSNEGGSTFECSLVPFGEPGSFSSCPSAGKTYFDLADGEYTFEVRAKDPAGNQGAPDSFTWEVKNSLNDETPPETTIFSKPPSSSDSPTAAFTYESSESGSTFECKLDSGAFVGCDATGVTYFGLANGPHSFQVRARDPNANLDPSPAVYSWTVAVVTFDPPPILPPPLQEIATSGTPAPPQTILTGKPRGVTRDRTPSFRFRSNVAGARFGCKVDGGPFRSCTSPFTTKTLTFGAHTVQIRATAGGAVDPSPTRSRFTVAGPKPRRR